MNNLSTRIIRINQYFRLFFNFYTPPNSNICIRQFPAKRLCFANRTQHVGINEAASSVLPINFGVPQGMCPSTAVPTVHTVYLQFAECGKVQ